MDRTLQQPSQQPSRRVPALRAVAARTLLAGCLAVALVSAARPVDDEVDPYSKGDPELLAAAGYLSLGPFPWADGVDTEDVDAILGDVTMRWVETPHFRIGSSLPAYRVPNAEKDGVREELKALKQLLPKVNVRTKRLDPWLRLHLYALRLERLHAELCELLGVDDDDFVPATEGGKYMGEGPCLGMPGKPTVLLFEKSSSLGRYRVRFTDQTVDAAVRRLFYDPPSMTFATSIETGKGLFDEDVSLHCHVVFNVTHNLVNSFKYFAYKLPVWVPEGISHWFRRRVDPVWNQFTAVKDNDGPGKAEQDWAVRVRARVGHEYFPAAEELMNWMDYDDLSVVDHMMIWSRIDFLIDQGPDRFARFMDVLKDHPGTVDGLFSVEQVQARQVQALGAAYQLEPDVFDVQWAAWVEATYPKK